MDTNPNKTLFQRQLATLPLSHAALPTPSRPAAWLRGAGAVGAQAPLFLVRDLGAILTCPVIDFTSPVPSICRMTSTRPRI